MKRWMLASVKAAMSSVRPDSRQCFRNLAVTSGAVVEWAGMGRAYDTWRRRPEYQQWQERIERLRSQRPQHVSGQGNRQ